MHVCLTVAYDQFLETELGSTAHLCSSTTARSPAGDTARLQAVWQSIG